jgi:hypothetical protein
MSFGDGGCCLAEQELAGSILFIAPPLGSSLNGGARENRFETFPDPFNNWIVWDLKKDKVAQVGSQILQFLSEAKAREFCALLNQQEPKIAA